mmetsp:Transcript_36666/g.67220  ORF Transcript_36666/g.67220 Transcript_36666/m.67220 type:complete len:457 (-) Transcript_36666:113-1483(-)
MDVQPAAAAQQWWQVQSDRDQIQSGICPRVKVSNEDEALCQDMESQVKKFLEGAWDEEEDDDEEHHQASPAKTGKSRELGTPEKVAPPTKPGSQDYLQTGTAKASGQAAQTTQLETPDPEPENTDQFLNVLRRRALPAELSTPASQLKMQVTIQGCVGSLYRDRLKPTLNQLQKRLKERAGTGAEIQAILPLCARAPDKYCIVPPMNGEQPVVLLRQEPPDFKGWVDVENTEDIYSQDTWEAVCHLLKETFGSLSFSSQPQQAARELQDLDVPALCGLALAELEHIIRLCLGKYRILVHHSDGRLRASKAKIRGDGKNGGGRAGPASFPLGANRPSREQQGPESKRLGNLYWNTRDEVASLDDLAVMLLTIMPMYGEGMPLSVLKQLVLNKFRLHLNEASFGCSRLVELFSFDPLDKIFPLAITHHNELTIQQPVVENVPPHIWHRVLHQMKQGAW